MCQTVNGQCSSLAEALATMITAEWLFFVVNMAVIKSIHSLIHSFMHSFKQITSSSNQHTPVRHNWLNDRLDDDVTDVV